MSEKRGFNPFLLVVGLVVGAAGALVIKDPKIKKSGIKAAKSLFDKLKNIANEAEGLNNQLGLDDQKKKIGKTKK